MGYHLVSLRDALQGILSEAYQLRDLENYASKAVFFDWKGYWCFLPYRTIDKGYYATVESILEFEEQMLFMRDGNGPIWG